MASVSGWVPELVVLSFVLEGPKVERGCQRNLVCNRLRKDHLVRKGREFNTIYSKGKRLHGEGFTLVCLPNKTEISRIGISVHRRIRGAVKRNRIKRIIRESFRNERDKYPRGVDIVFAVRHNFFLKNPNEISEAVGQLSLGFTCCHNLRDEDK